MKYLSNEPKSPIAHLVLAHGAGASMDHPWMSAVTDLLVERRIAVTRFEFAFMAAARHGSKRRPAPRGDKLVPEFIGAVEDLLNVNCGASSLFISGKSLGGRVATMAAPQLFLSNQIAGVVSFGYPFHPPKKPDTLRTAHLAAFECPALIIQGTRDPLGMREEVESYSLDPRIAVHWLEDGDHDLKPRKRSGFTADQHLTTAADWVAEFVRANAQRSD